MAVTKSEKLTSCYSLIYKEVFMKLSLEFMCKSSIYRPTGFIVAR